ncbi:MAG: hypothetical protein PHE55_20365 [Methylococcaceae bacterium]|nr:hypothetical protein [Methylococcaceae bacterium]
MANFPIREFYIPALAQGLTVFSSVRADIFRSSPVKPEDLRGSLAAYHPTGNSYTTAHVQALEARAGKQAALDPLTEPVKSKLRYDENTASGGEPMPPFDGSDRRKSTPLGKCRLLEK